MPVPAAAAVAEPELAPMSVCGARVFVRVRRGSCIQINQSCPGCRLRDAHGCSGQDSVFELRLQQSFSGGGKRLQTTGLARGQARDTHTSTSASTKIRPSIRTGAYSSAGCSGCAHH